MLSTAVQLSPSNPQGFLRNPRTAIVGAAKGDAESRRCGGQRVGSGRVGGAFHFLQGSFAESCVAVVVDLGK